MKTVYGGFDLLQMLQYADVVAADCETTGLHWYRDKAFGVALAGYDKSVDTIYSTYFDLREAESILPVLRKFLPLAKRVVNHNIKFDSHFLRNLRVPLPLDRVECTQVRAALINEHEESFSLDALCLKYIKEGKPTGVYEELAKMFGGEPTRKAQMPNLHRAPERLAAKYAMPDPALAIKLWLWQEQEIERQGLQQVWDLERRLTPVLIKLEARGVRVDEGLAAGSMYKVDKAVMVAQDRLNSLAGKPVNANSAPQMRTLFGANKAVEGERALWRTDAGVMLDMTDGGEASIDKKSLKIMADLGDTRAKEVLTIRRMARCKTFLKDHILAHAFGGRVYPNYNQTRGDNELGTGTGRLSINDPALQQIPMHDRDVAEIVRPCFLPELKHKWACCDWSQFEFRVFAHYVKDPTILKMYADDPNADFHQTVANITGITRDRKFAGDTANAKQINLGLVFGMGEGEMAYNMGMDYTIRSDKSGREWKIAGDKAKAVFQKYHAAIPGVRALLDQAASIARSRGYVKTLMGRHIRFPGGQAAYKAGGLTFQGTSADSIKLKMIEMDAVCEQEGFDMLLSVHDELDFSMPTKEAARMVALTKKRLETFNGLGCPIALRVPVVSSVALGNSWWEASK